MITQLLPVALVLGLMAGAVVAVVRLNRTRGARNEVEAILRQLIDGAFKPRGDSILGTNVDLIAVHTSPKLIPVLRHMVALQEGGRDREAIEETVLAYDDVLPGQAKALLYAHAGNGLGRLGLFDEAKRHYVKAVASARESQYPSAEGAALISLSMLADRREDASPDDARQYGEDALEVYQSMSDEPRTAQTLSYLAGLAQAHGEVDLADARHREALEIYTRRSDKLGRAHSLTGMANACLRRGELDQARDDLEEALKIHRRGGSRSGEAANLGDLGQVHEQLGQLELASKYYRDARARFQEVGDERGVKWMEERLSGIGT